MNIILTDEDGSHWHSRLSNATNGSVSTSGNLGEIHENVGGKADTLDN